MPTSTVCVALSAVCLAAALLTAYRRRFRAAAFATALALLPVGLYLTGLITLGGTIGRAVGAWAAHLVLGPSVWVGFALLAGSVLLITAVRVAGRRGRGAAGRASAGQPAAVPGPGSRAIPASGGARGTNRTPAGRQAGKAAAGPRDDALSDFRDVEEILKRRGI